ncbi:MAG: aminotransferase class V-fold PLP-dependent enzyme [Actinomycetota bacterium]
MAALNRDRWPLDPATVFLNHGSFGAVPRQVLQHQQDLRDRMESDPVRFFVTEHPGLLGEAVQRCARFVGADPEGFAFVTNATTGVNTVLRAAPLSPGDEILVTDHEYEACILAAEYVARRRGGSVSIARIPSVVDDPQQVIDAVLGAVTPATRLAVIDHVTSATALVLPVAEIVAALAERGVDAVVDGAHAPGMVDLDVRAVGAATYTGNWHKWVCSPKGAAFLWVSPGWRDRVRPLVISHGAGEEGVDRFRATFDWTGTADPSAYLSVPAAIEAVGGMMEGGWPAIRARNRAVALEMRRRVIDALGLTPTGPESTVGSMAAFVVPERWVSGPPSDAARNLILRLLDAGVTIGASSRRGSPDVFLRVSAHLHTEADDVEALIGVLRGW